jgi:hypothetical protein
MNIIYIYVCVCVCARARARARHSYSCNECLQNTYCCIINKNITKISCSLYVLLRAHSFLFSILCSGIVGTGEVRPEDMLRSEFSGTHFGDCYVITVLWDVT